MKAWLCIFFPCVWQHVINYMTEDARMQGLWQCNRCKTVSTGRALELKKEEESHDAER